MKRSEMLRFCSVDKVPFIVNGGKFEQLNPEDITTLPSGHMVYFFNSIAVDFDELCNIEITEGTIIAVRVRKGMKIQDEVTAYQLDP